MQYWDPLQSLWFNWPRSKWSTNVLSSLLQRDGDSDAEEYQDQTLRKPLLD